MAICETCEYSVAVQGGPSGKKCSECGCELANPANKVCEECSKKEALCEQCGGPLPWHE